MANWSGRVYQDGQCVAAAYGTEAAVRAEVAHYALVYGQDGPVKVRIRKLKDPADSLTHPLHVGFAKTRLPPPEAAPSKTPKEKP